jgi:hypothetical protein
MPGRLRVTLLFVFLLMAAASAFAATNPPVITSLSPKDTIAGTGQLTVDVFGANFVSGAQVRVNNTNHPTTFVDAGHLQVTIFASDTSSPKSLNIVVANPAGFGTSTAVTFTVLPNSPTINSVSPTSIPVKSTDLAIHIKGVNFASNATVRVNNTDRDTTFVDSSTLDATLQSTDVSSARTLTITVVNPQPTIKTSNSVTISVTNGTAAPVLTVLSPDNVVEDSGAFTLTIFGNNFVATPTVLFNNLTHLATFVSATKITTTINGTDIANPGTATVVVRNPDGKTSNTLTFTILAKNQPTLTSISPSTVTAHSSAFTLTVTGTNFIAGAKVNVNSTAHTATFVDSTTLTTSIFSTEVQNPGTLSISVTNPGTPALTTGTLPLYVVDPNAPVITGLNPQSVTAGSGIIKVLVNGSGFLNTDKVLFNGTEHPTEFAGDTQLAVTLSADDTATVGQFPIAVRHQLNSVTSAPATFNVTAADAGPVITLLNPSTAAMGGTPFTLQVIGTGFTTDSIVSVDGQPRTTTFVSSTQLTVPIFASDLTAVRQIPVTVTNPGLSPSVPVNLNVAIVTPVITSLSPSTVIAGDSGFNLVVNGTGFSSTAIINVNGQSQVTQFDSTTGSLSASVLASAITNVGHLDITVTDRGITSAVSPLQIVGPRITALSPQSVTAGSGATTLIVSGTNFLPTSVIVFGGVDKLTSFAAASGTLSTTLTAADLANPGTAAVVVRNTFGALSNPVVFTVVSPGAPAILQLTPSTIVAGSSATEVTITGVNFLPSAVVSVNGTSRQTAFDNEHQLRVTLSAAELASEGTLTFTVTNGDGTTSAPVQLTITPAGSGTPPARRRAVPH